MPPNTGISLAPPTFSPFQDRKPQPRVIIVFEDRDDSAVLRLLDRGFRHCFCVIGSGLAWTICDPLKTRIELFQAHGLDERTLAQHYHSMGRTVLIGDAPANRPSCPYRLRPMTCVEIVKRIVHLDAPYVFTPAQLYRALLDQKRTLIRYVLFPGSTQEAPQRLDSAQI
jgi:hypothetical protein